MYKMIGADGREYGPVPAEQLRQWVVEGRANLQTRVQLEGTAEWKTIAEFPELTGPPPGSPPPVILQPAAGIRVPNYLVQSILITLCCCFPFGIPAIVFATQVNSKLAGGDVAGAQEASRKARLWCWLGLGFGIVIHIITSLLWLSTASKKFLQ